MTSDTYGSEIYGDYNSASEAIRILEQVATRVVELEDGKKYHFTMNGAELSLTSGEVDFCVNGTGFPALEVALNSLYEAVIAKLAS